MMTNEQRDDLNQELFEDGYKQGKEDMAQLIVTALLRFHSRQELLDLVHWIADIRERDKLKDKK